MENNQVVGFSCYDNIYLKFEYIGDDEFEELIDYIEDNHLSYEGATDTFIDLEKENKILKERIKKTIEYCEFNMEYVAELEKVIDKLEGRIE